MPTEPESRVTERSKIAIASILATIGVGRGGRHDGGLSACSQAVQWRKLLTLGV